MNIIFCGCGALGSRLALAVASVHPDFSYLLIDDDRVGAENIPVSAFDRGQIKSMKVNALSYLMYQRYGAKANTFSKTLETHLFKARDEIVIDSFDNERSRAMTAGGLNTLHVGMSESLTADIIWDELFSPSKDEFERGENPVCTNHLGLGITLMTVAMAFDSLERYISTGERRSYHITRDRNIIRL